MSRLTIKNPKGKQRILNDGAIINHFSDLTNSWMICDKLGKLEDIEEELGCPLDVVFKALKEGVRYFDGKTYTTTSKVNYECLLLDIELKAFRVMTEPMPYSNDTWREYDTLHLKDYKKTWWLKEDLSQ